MGMLLNLLYDYGKNVRILRKWSVRVVHYVTRQTSEHFYAGSSGAAIVRRVQSRGKASPPRPCCHASLGRPGVYNAQSVAVPCSLHVAAVKIKSTPVTCHLSPAKTGHNKATVATGDNPLPLKRSIFWQLENCVEVLIRLVSSTLHFFQLCAISFV